MTAAFQHLSDNDLAVLAQKGDDGAFSELMVRMMPMIRKRAGRYSLPGLEPDDIVQEGLLGLLCAVRRFDPALGSFAAFAAICVSSHMASAAKAALSGKSRPLMDYAPLDDTALPVFAQTPEEQMLLSERMTELGEKMDTLLSRFEQNTLRLYLSGLSYSRIALLQHTSAKAVDNALQRVRRKLRPV